MTAELSLPAPAPPSVPPPVAALLDPGSVAPLRALDGSGACAVTGRVDGRTVVVYATDASVMGGAMGAQGCRHIVAAIEEAVRRGCPVYGLWHSGGARLREGVESLDGVGRVFAAMVGASGRVPQISVVLGPAAGGAAYGPALTDLVVTGPAARVFVTGPDVVAGVTGEQVDAAGLGGPDVHARRSGVVHVTAASESEAVATARRLGGFFTAPGAFRADPRPARADLSALLPASRRRAYDVRPVVAALLDPPPGGGAAPLLEIQPRFAPSVVTGLGRLCGRAVGVVANNPLRLGGCLDASSAEKAARFVRLCDAFGIPLVVLVDVPGYLPGVDQEWAGVVRRGAKLLYAFAEATVPRATLILRKSYGGALIAMNSHALGASAVFAWPEAEVAVMGAHAAVGIVERRRLASAPEHERAALHGRLAEEFARTAGGVQRALASGVIDEVIDPRDSRERLARALAGAPARRGRHGNIPL